MDVSFHTACILYFFLNGHYTNAMVHAHMSLGGEERHSAMLCSIHHLHSIHYCIIAHLWYSIETGSERWVQHVLWQYRRLGNERGSQF